MHVYDAKNSNKKTTQHKNNIVKLTYLLFRSTTIQIRKSMHVNYNVTYLPSFLVAIADIFKEVLVLVLS